MAKNRNRRTFLRTLAAAPAVASVSVTEAQESPDAARVNLLAESVRLRYGQYLGDGDMGEIKRGIERMQRTAETLAKVKTTNSDEPDLTFHPSETA